MVVPLPSKFKASLIFMEKNSDTQSLWNCSIDITSNSAN